MTAAIICAKCPRATRPLPTDWSTLDFFDKPVAAQDAVFRVACGVELDANKPCLRPAPASTSTSKTEGQTFPFSNSFDSMGSDSAVYLCPRSIDRLNAAVQGAHALIALLAQREMDADIELTTPCTFGTDVALGILSALSCCTEVVSAAADGRIFPMAQRVQVGSEAHQHMEQAAMQAGRMERGQK